MKQEAPLPRRKPPRESSEFQSEEHVNKPPDWEETLDDLDRRRQHAWAMGGPERLAKHRDKGKLDARARIARLLDP
ncbi:MAG: hypothetical protein ACRDRN_27240, partial [Sciscionella sp.]